MKIRNFPIFLLVLVAFFAFAGRKTPAQTGKLTLSSLKGDFSGCGCSFQTLAEARKRGSMKIVFWSEDENAAIVNLNGKDTTFKITRKGKRPGVFRIGNRFSDVYASGGITLKIDYLVTRVCLPGEESCEVTDFDATITVSRGKQRTVLKTKGGCGC